ncbi:MAG: hypothetical protein KDC38_15550 [Planctomycetes bacterium]|nr:hypothetical protein [Planctomycetota bacterium]
MLLAVAVLASVLALACLYRGWTRLAWIGPIATVLTVWAVRYEPGLAW